MNFKSMFKRKTKAKGGIISVIRGINETEWLSIYEAVLAEYNLTAAKHKKPTEYMRGLTFAIGAMEAVKPHNITMEVQ